MKLFLTLLAVLAIAVTARADDTAAATPDSELAAAVKFVYGGKFSHSDIEYVRCFTTYAVPKKFKLKAGEVDLRHECELALPFVLNSTASFRSEGFIEKPRRVPGSDTLWYIDIRDYGWSVEDIDAVFDIQTYFLHQLVDSSYNNVLFRADWFVANVMDTTKQEDRGLKTFPYYILQYGKGNEPKNADDFRKAWDVDIKTIRARKVETGTIVDAGDSGVSQHTRQLRRGRTVLGYYWETRDVKSHDFDPQKLLSRDYVEDIFANQADAGEYIATNTRGLQTYLLTAGNNDKFKVVQFGDPTIVVDRQDPVDPRVRTGKSCVICHANGIIPYTNTIRELFRKGGDLKAKDKDLQREIKAFYLRYQGEDVAEDSKIFEKSVKDCNGLDPAENARCFNDVYGWYSGKVTLDQAACEVGLSTVEYKKVIRATTTGRLTLLYRDTPIPRDAWDSLNAGAYVQSVLLHKGLAAPAKQEGTVPAKEKAPAPEAKPAEALVGVDTAALVDNDGNLLVYLGRGFRVSIVREVRNEWYFVRAGKIEGYLRKGQVTPAR